MHKLRNLLIAATNELITAGKIKLDHEPVESGHIRTTLLGKSAVIIWQDIGHEEIRISVWWDYNHDNHPQDNECFKTSTPLAKSRHYPKFVGAFASAWLERKEGFYLQGHGSERIFDTYVRRDIADELEAIPEITPNGFKPEGAFHF